MRNVLTLTGKDCIRAVLYHCTVENSDFPQYFLKTEVERPLFNLKLILCDQYSNTKA